MKLHGLGRAVLVVAALWPLAASGAPPAAAPDSARTDSLHVKLWETQIHSVPEVTHRGQVFDLHVHVIWGSRTGDEAVLPLWRPQAGFTLMETAYSARSTRDQPGGGYALHAKIIYRLRADREGLLSLDSVRVQLVRGNAHRDILFARTAMKVLPPVSLWPAPWNLAAFALGIVALVTGLVLLRRRRPRRAPVREPTPEERAAARLLALEKAAPDKPALDALLVYIRQEAVRRYGGAWTRAGGAAFEEWSKASTAPERVREHISALTSHLESRLYVPEDPEPTTWAHWMDETRRLWRTDEELEPVQRPN